MRNRRASADAAEIEGRTKRDEIGNPALQ